MEKQKSFRAWEMGISSGIQSPENQELSAVAATVSLITETCWLSFHTHCDQPDRNFEIHVWLDFTHVFFFNTCVTRRPEWYMCGCVYHKESHQIRTVTNFVRSSAVHSETVILVRYEGIGLDAPPNEKIHETVWLSRLSQKETEFLPKLDAFYFTTDEKKIVEDYRCIVPDFIIND